MKVKMKRHRNSLKWSARTLRMEATHNLERLVLKSHKNLQTLIKYISTCNKIQSFCLFVTDSTENGWKLFYEIVGCWVTRMDFSRTHICIKKSVSTLGWLTDRVCFSCWSKYLRSLKFQKEETWTPSQVYGSSAFWKQWKEHRPQGWRAWRRVHRPSSTTTPQAAGMPGLEMWEDTFHQWLRPFRVSPIAHPLLSPWGDCYNKL